MWVALNNAAGEAVHECRFPFSFYYSSMPAHALKTHKN
jgi:hypothetical protein